MLIYAGPIVKLTYNCKNVPYLFLLGLAHFYVCLPLGSSDVILGAGHRHPGPGNPPEQQLSGKKKLLDSKSYQKVTIKFTEETGSRSGFGSVIRKMLDPDTH
jgi:hypothetical protein